MQDGSHPEISCHLVARGNTATATDAIENPTAIQNSAYMGQSTPTTSTDRTSHGRHERCPSDIANDPSAGHYINHGCASNPC